MSSRRVSGRRLKALHLFWLGYSCAFGVSFFLLFIFVFNQVALMLWYAALSCEFENWQVCLQTCRVPFFVVWQIELVPCAMALCLFPKLEISSLLAPCTKRSVVLQPFLSCLNLFAICCFLRVMKIIQNGSCVFPLETPR